MERRSGFQPRPYPSHSPTVGGHALRVIGAIILFVALVISGCSKSDGRDKSEDTSEKKSAEQSNTSTILPGNTLPDDEFFAGVEAAKQAIADAGTDPCKLAPALGLGVGTPANKAQAQALVELYDAIFSGVANVLGPDSSAGKSALDLSKRMQELAKANDYEPAFMAGPEIAKFFSDEEFQQAGLAFQNLTAECSDQAADGVDSPLSGAAPDDTGQDGSDGASGADGSNGS